jgi:TatD DNase family protein
MVALHPNYSKSIDLINWLENINSKDIVGIGECGIDLYWKDNPSLKVQQKVFIKHLDYAKKHNLPVVVHSRNAEKETF